MVIVEEEKKEYIRDYMKQRSESHILIGVKRETAQLLKELDFAKMGDNYDTVIKRLVLFYEQHKGAKERTVVNLSKDDDYWRAQQFKSY